MNELLYLAMNYQWIVLPQFSAVDSATWLHFFFSFIIIINFFFHLAHVQADTTYIVYSWNDIKPTVSGDTYNIARHQQRNWIRINLLNGLVNPPEVPSTASTFKVAVDNVRKID